MTTVSAAQVAKEVLNQGGSDQQAWVAAALVSGIESNGEPTDKNPTSSACGLFQFLTTTWAANGGTKYAPTACGATWQQQVTVFLNASQANNFYAWAPDLGGSYNGAPIYGPKSGSPVANEISQLASTGTLKFLGNVPQTWADAGGATPTSGIGSLVPGGGSSATSQCSPVISGLSVTLLNSCQAAELLGGLLIGVGALAIIIGFAAVLADVGLRKSAPAILGAVVGDQVGKRSANRRMTEREHSAGLKTQDREHSVSARKAARGTTVTSASPAQKRRWEQEGFEGDE